MEEFPGITTETSKLHLPSTFTPPSFAVHLQTPAQLSTKVLAFFNVSRIRWDQAAFVHQRQGVGGNPMFRWVTGNST
ncbi:unnamed protein product, partial [Dicrocoelium dendriticum]